MSQKLIINKCEKTWTDKYLKPSEKLTSETSKIVDMPNISERIIDKCDEIKEMLLEKNRKYGNSALDPIRVFSKANNIEQIKVRLDDKLSRIKSAQSDEDEDVLKDLIGYLILLLIAKESTFVNCKMEEFNVR